MIRFILGVVLVTVALLVPYLLEGGNLGLLVGLSAFLLTFFVPFFAVLAVWPFSAWVTAWKDALGKPVSVERSTAVWKFSEVACYLTGLLGSLTGGILILANWEGADPAHLARSFGVLLVAPLYSTVLALICRILRARVAARN